MKNKHVHGLFLVTARNAVWTLFKSAAEAGAHYSRRHARKPGDHDPVQDTEA